MSLPLGALRIFEAASRHSSFKLAADELGLSPSAVSHAISKLEREIGASLFERDGRLLTLTADGEALRRPLEEAFGLIRAGLNAVSARQGRILRLHSAPSFAAQWLRPRLAGFMRAHPDMEVSIAASPDHGRFATDEFDADIVYGFRHQEGLVSHPLGPELVRPMCAPELAAQIKRPEDLLRCPLIRSAVKEVSWEGWFRANGIAAPRRAGMSFDRSFMAIAAAADGHGVCLESVLLAGPELASGRLVAPLAGLAVDLSEASHFLVYPKRNAERAVVTAFTDWITTEMAA